MRPVWYVQPSLRVLLCDHSHPTDSHVSQVRWDMTVVTDMAFTKYSPDSGFVAKLDIV